MAGKPEVTVAFDGASRGNPGRAAIGVVVLKGGVPVREIGERIGTTTNNIAEYRALLRGLEEAAALGARTVRIQSDSELVVRQLSGQYKVRSPTLAPLHRRARPPRAKRGRRRPRQPGPGRRLALNPPWLPCYHSGREQAVRPRALALEESPGSVGQGAG